MAHIRIDRRILEWGWYKDEHTKSLFLHCLLMANWKDTIYKGMPIRRGQFATSIPKLGIELELTSNEVRTAIKHLKTTGEITVKAYSKFSVITVVKYDEYQARPQSESQTENRRTTVKSQSINSLLTDIEEESKEEKERNDNIVEKIIGCLNATAGTRYRPQSCSTKNLITARLNDGYGLDDFVTVIDKKVKEWKGTELEKYLRPQTLFGTKFECYLNQSETKPQKKANSFNSFPQRDRSKTQMDNLEKRLLRQQEQEV